ncbi:MAG: hypothetical protein KF799_07735 [Bdellovibrionales bacterium]|nr:hypothetical protein [Bdellovibrionales bacterium]
MKVIVVVLLSVVVQACASQQKKETDLGLLSVNSMFNESTTKNDVLKRLGAPNKSQQTANGERWSYTDPKDGGQKLTVTFTKDNTIKSVLWLPSDETEASFSIARKALNPSMLDVVGGSGKLVRAGAQTSSI